MRPTSRPSAVAAGAAGGEASAGFAGVSSPVFAAAALVEVALPRSFLAQPEPLKWIAGAANCLRIVPSAPHEGQKFGPGSLSPWRMSAR